MGKRKRITVQNLMDSPDLEPGEIEIYDSRSGKSRRFKPVSKPSAQTIKLCETGEDLESLLKGVLAKRDYILKEHKLLWYIIELQLSGGLRIAEVLSIMPGQILPTGHVLIKGKKGSSSRIVYTSDARGYLVRCRNNSVLPFMDYDRYWVYREYKKLGIGTKFKGKGNASVTHFFRQLNARLQQMSDVELENIGTFLGHKSQQSTQYYVNK